MILLRGALGLLLLIGVSQAQTLVLSTQVNPKTTGPCVLVVVNSQVVCAVLSPLVTLTTTGGITTISVTGTTSTAGTPIIESFVPLAGSQVITISHPALAGTEVVSRNGLVMTPGTDYGLSGTVISFVAVQSLLSTDIIRVSYRY